MPGVTVAVKLPFASEVTTSVVGPLIITAAPAIGEPEPPRTIPEIVAAAAGAALIAGSGMLLAAGAGAVCANAPDGKAIDGKAINDESRAATYGRPRKDQTARISSPTSKTRDKIEGAGEMPCDTLFQAAYYPHAERCFSPNAHTACMIATTRIAITPRKDDPDQAPLSGAASTVGCIRSSSRR